MSDRYYRLITFIVNIGTPVLKEFLIHCAKMDPVRTFTTFEAYMISRKHDIQRLRSVRHDQVRSMFPNVGQFEESALDISLLSTLVLNLFGTSLQPLEKHAIENVRNIRNSLQHKGNTSSVDESEFDSKWSALKSRLLLLSNIVGGTTYHDQISAEILDILTNNLPNLGECLRYWYMSLNKELKEQLVSGRKQLRSVRSQLKSTSIGLKSNLSELKSVKSKLTKSTKKMSSSATMLCSVKTDVQSTTTELIRVKSELNSASTELISTTTELNLVKSELNYVTAELVSVKRELKGVQTEMTSLNTGVKTVEQQSKAAKLESRNAATMISNVVEKRKNREGILYKRVKTVDRRADKIKDNLKITLRNYRDDGLTFPDRKEILNLLQNKHRIVITGTNIRYCIQIAVKVIEDIRYDMQSCVEITNRDEWNSVEPADTRLVLCKHPFGHLSFDEQKARGMFEAFTSMLNSTSDTVDDRIDIILVSQKAIMQDAIRLITRGEGHELLEDVVDVDIACVASETHNATGPDDSEQVGIQIDDQQFQYRLDLTTSYISSRKRFSLPFATGFVEEVKEKLRQCKCIVLNGQKGCGKTSVAIELASMYDPSHCLKLSNPKDIKFVNGKRTSLVLVEDFCGKYMYDENKMHKWFETFEKLHFLAQDESIDVVITCSSDQFKKCKNDAVTPLLLQHVVHVPNLTVLVNTEHGEIKDDESVFLDTTNGMREFSKPVQLNLHRSVKVEKGNGEVDTPFYSGMDFLSDNRLVTVDNNNRKCQIFNGELQKVGKPYHFNLFPQDVCTLPDSKLAVTTGSRAMTILHVDSCSTITCLRNVNTFSQYESISPISDITFALTTYDDPKTAGILTLSDDMFEESDFHDITFPDKVYSISESEGAYIQGTDTFVLSDRSDHTVFMYNRKGKTTCLVRDDRIKDPRGVCIGPANSVFVCSLDTGSIVHIASNGMIINSYPVEMTFPTVVAVSKDTSQMVLTNRGRYATDLQLYNIIT